MTPDVEIEDEERDFGEMLVRERLVSERQLKTAYEYQRSLGGGRLRDILVKLGFVKDNVLDSFIGERVRMPTIDISDREIDAWAMQRVPRQVIEKYQVLPLKHPHGAGTILLAMGEPSNYAAIEEVQFLTNKKVETALATRAAVKKAINQYYNMVQEDTGRPQPAAPSGDEWKGIPADDMIRALATLLVERKVVSRDEVLARLRKR